MVDKKLLIVFYVFLLGNLEGLSAMDVSNVTALNTTVIDCSKKLKSLKSKMIILRRAIADCVAGRERTNLNIDFDSLVSGLIKKLQETKPVDFKPNDSFNLGKILNFNIVMALVAACTDNAVKDLTYLDQDPAECVAIELLSVLNPKAPLANKKKEDPVIKGWMVGNLRKIVEVLGSDAVSLFVKAKLNEVILAAEGRASDLLNKIGPDESKVKERITKNNQSADAIKNAIILLLELKNFDPSSDIEELKGISGLKDQKIVTLLLKGCFDGKMRVRSKDSVSIAGTDERAGVLTLNAILSYKNLDKSKMKIFVDNIKKIDDVISADDADRIFLKTEFDRIVKANVVIFSLSDLNAISALTAESLVEDDFALANAIIDELKSFAVTIDFSARSKAKDDKKKIDSIEVKIKSLGTGSNTAETKAINTLNATIKKIKTSNDAAAIGNIKFDKLVNE